MKKLIIIGAGGFAREVAWLVETINDVQKEWELVGFFDEFAKDFNPINGYKLLNETEFKKEINDSFLIISIGDGEVRKKIVDKLGPAKYATLVDPNILLSKTTTIGEGSIICHGTILTVNINIGKHVIINLDCTVGHDAILDDYVTLLPSVNVSGHVKVGECSTVGTGSQIIQNINVGTNTIIGAGSVVVKDISSYCVAVGIPAKEIKNRR